MRILLIHNKYQQAGGEDSVFFTEIELLKQRGHLVECLIFDSNEIKTWWDKLMSGFYLIYNPVSAKVVRKMIKSFNPDVAHVHNFVPLASPSVFFVAHKNNIPVVLTLHNYRLLCPSATLFYNNSIYERSLNSGFPFHAIFKGVYRNSRIQTAALATMIFFHKIIGTWKRKVSKYIVLTQFALHKFKGSTLGISENQLVVKPNFVLDHGRGEIKREFFFICRQVD